MNTLRRARSASVAALVAAAIALASLIGFAGSAFAQTYSYSNESYVAPTWAWNAQYNPGSNCYAYSGQYNPSCIGYWSYNDYGYGNVSNNSGWGSQYGYGNWY